MTYISLVTLINGQPVNPDETQIVTVTTDDQKLDTFPDVMRSMQTTNQESTTRNPESTITNPESTTTNQENKINDSKIMKMSNDHQKLRHHGMKKKRGKYRRVVYCKTTETPPTKPTKIYIQMPNMFISQSWGPNR